MDPEIVRGKWIHLNESQELKNELKNKSGSSKGRLDDVQDTDFWWWVKQHDASSISVKFLFKDPSKVSNSLSDDFIIFEIKRPKYFKTQDGIIIGLTYYYISLTIPE